MPFAPEELGAWETYRTAARTAHESISVSGAKSKLAPVGLHVSSQTLSVGIYISAERARELAAELVAAVDSLPKEGA